MSKMDNLRAMREARYEAAQAAAKAGAKPTAQTPAKAAAKRPATRPTTAVSTATDAPAATTEAEALCGHRNMSGRTCTREHGHTAKSHRYS